MKTKEQIEEQLIYVRARKYRNSWDSDIWEKVEKYLKWVIEDQL